MLIGRGGGLSFLCYSCGFTCQHRGLKTFPGPSYLRSEDGVVWLWHLLVNLYIYIYVHMHIYIYIYIYNTHTDIYIYIYIYIYMYMYKYIYVYPQARVSSFPELISVTRVNE